MSAICRICFTELIGKRELKEGKCISCLTPSRQKLTEEARASKSEITFPSKDNSVPSVYLGF